MEGRGSSLAAAEALEHVSFLDQEYAALQAVEPDQVRTAAARYLGPDNVAAVAYLPETEGTDLTPRLLERCFAVSALRTPSREATPVRAVPRSAPISGVWHDQVLHTSLGGVDLLVRHKSGVPLVTVGLYAPRIGFDPPAKAGLAALGIRSSVRGAGEFDAGGLAFAFERIGGTLSPNTTADWLGFGTTVLSRHLAEAADLLQLVFADPRLADHDLLTERGLMAIEAEQVADDMFRYPFQLGFAAAFGDREYGLPVGGLPETVPSITPDEVRAWHARELLGARPVVIAVGEVEPEEATATLAAVFQNHRPSSVVQGGEEGNGRGKREAERVVCREKAQAAMAMIFPGPRRRDPDRYAADVWAAVASGLGGRMFEALRDRRSLAYTVLASSWQRGRAGALVTYIATSPEREEEARRAMLEELARFRQEPVTETELVQAVNYLAGQAEVSRQSAAALAGEILEAWMIGNGLEDLRDPGAAYRSVTAQDVLQVAQRNLVPELRSEGIVRGSGIKPRADG
jgi:zinc protease